MLQQLNHPHALQLRLVRCRPPNHQTSPRGPHPLSRPVNLLACLANNLLRSRQVIPQHPQDSQPLNQAASPVCFRHLNRLLSRLSPLASRRPVPVAVHRRRLQHSRLLAQARIRLLGPLVNHQETHQAVRPCNRQVRDCCVSSVVVLAVGII